jgi:hypothetical protein
MAAMVAAAFVLALVPSLATAATANPFVESAASMASGHGYPAAVPLPGGTVLVAGGFQYGAPQDHYGEGTKKALIFDPATGSFSATGEMSQPHWLAAAAPLADGRVLVAGGLTGNEFQENINRTEIYDPKTGEFSLTGSLATERWNAFAAPLPDGRVLVGGGGHFVWDSEGHRHVGELASTEIYDPETGKFSAGPSMSVPRAAAGAAVLPDGRILVAGGYNGAAGSSELFDPVTETFSSGPALATPAAGTATPLADGRVLFVGQESIQVYDPASEAFTDTGLTGLALRGASAATLPGGRVLLAGHSSAQYGSQEKEAKIFVSAPSATSPGLAFGEVPASETSGPQPLTVTNLGAQDLEVEGAALTGAGAADFEIVADECTGETLAFGESCDLRVSVTPSSSEPLSAAVTLTDNAPTSPQSFALSANAPEPAPAPTESGGEGEAEAETAAPEAGAEAPATAAPAAAGPAGASSLPAASSAPTIGTSKAKHSCKRVASVGKRHAARHARSNCSRPAAKSHEPAARHAS